MSLKQFNGRADMKINRVKAIQTYIKPKKKKLDNTTSTGINGYNDESTFDEQPWEHKYVKGLQGGKEKPKLEKEKLFDVLQDGKPMKIKKKTKKDKDTRAFIMMNEKKYHSIGGSSID